MTASVLVGDELPGFRDRRVSAAWHPFLMLLLMGLLHNGNKNLREPGVELGSGAALELGDTDFDKIEEIQRVEP